MTKKDDDSSRDLQLFRDAMRTVTPLARRRARVTPERPLPPIRRRPIEPDLDAPVDPLPLSDYDRLPFVGSDDFLQYTKNGVSEKTLRNLRRGQYNPGAVLDLHGKSTDAARLAIGKFLISCQQERIQCVHIIHGKGSGKPILKNRLNHWLRDIPFVLAFYSINLGTLSVLLRRSAS